jgi:N-acetyl-gamma-glutamyl-phosphate reductase common form
MNNKNSVLDKPLTVGIVGVRGYVGRELISLLANQPSLKVDWVSSRQLEGTLLSELLVDESPSNDDNFRSVDIDKNHYYHQIEIASLSAEAIAAKQTDIVVLALPNGLAKGFVSQLEQKTSCQLIIDLSADYRFDDSWLYSVPEINIRNKSLKQTFYNSDEILKISNPGCYATAMQLAIAPLLGKIQGRVHCFGISGYSGAGTNPCKNNDPNNLKDNVLPYALVEHIHEQEVSLQLKQPVSFSPHVASFFRGISMTVQVELEQALSSKIVLEVFEKYFNNNAFVKVVEDIPTIQQVNHTPYGIVGGFQLSADGKRLTIISCLDNLLKGAASQALQNISLAFNLDLDILGSNL